MLSLSKTIKKQPTGRILALGFLAVILAGSLLLMLPVCRIDGAELRYIDSLFTATSAVCVTGLVTVDVASTFSPLGQFVVALLIQIGGLGVASAGAALFLIMGKRVSIKGRSLLKDGLNLGSGGGIVRMLKTVLFSTLIIEGIGALLAFLIFLPDYPLGKALGKGIFHAVSAFNNAGFAILGDFKSLLDYSANIPMNLLTAALIILGGIGFPVIAELREKRLRPKSLSLHSKVVIWFSFWLIVIGTLITRLTEGTSWLEALFHSVSLRTAGFSTLNLAEFSEAGLLISCFFMVVGASPGSTGGGIKTTTLFALLQGLRASATGAEGRIPQGRHHNHHGFGGHHSGHGAAAFGRTHPNTFGGAVRSVQRSRYGGTFHRHNPRPRRPVKSRAYGGNVHRTPRPSHHRFPLALCPRAEGAVRRGRHLHRITGRITC